MFSQSSCLWTLYGRWEILKNKTSSNLIGYNSSGCPEQESNLHSLAGTGPWNQRVYQFRHLGKKNVGKKT